MDARAENAASDGDRAPEVRAPNAGQLVPAPEAPVAEAPAHLETIAIGKSFGGTRAVDDVSLTIETGSIHAFVGENGAGKSTLGRIIAGVIAPDHGRLVLRGTPVSFGSPRQALEHGIALVAQEVALVPQMTVAQNVYLGAEPVRAGFVDRAGLGARFRQLAADAGFDLPADVPVGRLPIGQQQQVEILRALARDAQLIVFDEPTAALSAAESEQLHRILRSLRDRGVTVILVSHFLREVLALADRITVLRDGRVVRTNDARNETEATLISAMLGRSLTRTFPPKAPPPPDAPAVLTIDELHAPGVDGVSLTVRAGEIVGLAGLIGAGRSELARAVFGAVPSTAGRVLALDRPVGSRPGAAMRAGIAMIPESRKDEGLVLGRPVRENVSLASLPSLSRLGFMRRPLENRRVRDGLLRLRGTDRLEMPAVALSGGNQQKLMFAGALLRRPRVLLADEPTRGVDVGAKREIYEHLCELAAGGVGILLISSEIEELLGLSHRIVVMRRGRVAAELRGEAMTEVAVLEAAFGASEPQEGVA